MNIPELMQYAFFRNALMGALLASIACGMIGTYVVSRRLVFISGGITHASFGGLGAGFFFAFLPFSRPWFSLSSLLRHTVVVAQTGGTGKTPPSSVFWSFEWPWVISAHLPHTWLRTQPSEYLFR